METGASVSSNPLFENTHGRAVAIEISNYSSRYDLRNPSYCTTSGYCCNPPPPTISKSGKGTCVFTKTGGTARGCVGVLTYQLSDHSIAIMFSNPFDYNLYRICYGMEIFNRHRTADENLFKEMYYAPVNAEKRRIVGSCSSHLELSYDGINVKATMSSSSKSIMKVEIHDLPE
ncbi:cytolysin tenebrosin-B-like [Protopterus annectens]|uniref:cytolysin tenebrosin-B-like n=1 Tax=Protopterus annectens TaxID=7888 RepID=UPI001CFB41B3|nr:cytolysin tenebrosin-B-like [Protopterus annectens]